eukprot:UN18495
MGGRSRPGGGRRNTQARGRRGRKTVEKKKSTTDEKNNKENKKIQPYLPRIQKMKIKLQKKMLKKIQQKRGLLGLPEEQENGNDQAKERKINMK